MVHVEAEFVFSTFLLISLPPGMNWKFIVQTFISGSLVKLSKGYSKDKVLQEGGQSHQSLISA